MSLSFFDGHHFQMLSPPQAAGLAPSGLSTVGPAPSSGYGGMGTASPGLSRCKGRGLPTTKGTAQCRETLAIACIGLLFFAIRECKDGPAENTFLVEGHLEGSRPGPSAPAPGCPRGSLYPSPNTACLSSPLCAKEAIDWPE